MITELYMHIPVGYLVLFIIEIHLRSHTKIAAMYMGLDIKYFPLFQTASTLVIE